MRDRVGAISALPALLLLALAILVGCGRGGAQTSAAAVPPIVRIAQPQPLGHTSLSMSGVVRARHESPLAFQIGGRVLARQVDAGNRVRRGEILMRLDPSDLKAAQLAASADHAAAHAALDVATADRQRAEEMVAKGFLSAQGADRARQVEREATTRLAAAAARVRQSSNALDYSELRAPADGVLAEVSVEPGQVVATGQPVAVLAQAGPREIEVQLPDGMAVPQAGELPEAGGKSLRLKLREVAGAADSRSRTWRARYRVEGGSAALPLGSVRRVVFTTTGVDQTLWQVPLGALDERSGGAQVWLVESGEVVPKAVELVGMSGEAATIRAVLASEAHIVALGAHLLQPGMAVREQAR